MMIKVILLVIFFAVMVAVGNYVICGSEGGTVYVFAKDSGAIVSQLDASADHMVNIRGAVAYADGNLWFTMTDGSIWRVAFSESDGSLGTASSAKITPTATNSTATPVIYNGRVYVGCTDTDASGSVQGAVAVLDASTLALIYEIPVAKQDNAWSNKCTDVAIAADTATGTVYGYAAYYDQPGSFVAFTDQPGQTAADSYDVRTLVPEGAANYSNGQILLGTEGNLYYTNDSGYMVCVGKKAEDGSNSGGSQNQGDSDNDQNPGGGDTDNSQYPTGGQTVGTKAEDLPETAPKTGDLPDGAWAMLILAGGISLGGVLLQKRMSR